MQTRYILISLLTGFLLSGCLVTEQDLVMQRDQLEMKRRLNDVERELKELQADASGGIRARVETLATNQADLQAGVDSLRVDMQGLQGRFDDQARDREELRQEMTLLRDELTLQMADLDQRLNQLETGPAASTPPPQAETATTPAATTQAPPATDATPEPAPPTPVEATAAGLYDRGLQQIREQQDFPAGRETLQTFLQRYPDDPLAANAAYWVGEGYYAEKAYDKAILQFEEVIQTYGDHPKVASALLKQSLAFDAMGDRANAKLLLQRVMERFPLSDEAKIAEAKLMEWQ